DRPFDDLGHAAWRPDGISREESQDEHPGYRHPRIQGRENRSDLAHRGLDERPSPVRCVRQMNSPWAFDATPAPAREVASFSKQPRVNSCSLSASTNSLSQPPWDQVALTAAMVGVAWPLQRNR